MSVRKHIVNFYEKFEMFFTLWEIVRNILMFSCSENVFCSTKSWAQVVDQVGSGPSSKAYASSYFFMGIGAE